MVRAKIVALLRSRSRLLVVVALAVFLVAITLQGTSGKEVLSERENAVIVSLARNEELHALLESIQSLEDRFNNKFHYDWIFLNEKPFSEDFINETTAMVSGKTQYGLIPLEHWSFPDYIDTEKAKKRFTELENVYKYGGQESYRHMCRFNSGFFYKHELLKPYKYYWRVEPGVKFYCDINYDVFKFMRENNKAYGFTVALFENPKTIPSLWLAVRDFLSINGLPTENFMEFLSSNKGTDYNTCHFWSNFEIADLDIWRSEFYENFFNFLDRTGGFFYERWGDAPVHTIGAALQLSADKFHFFEDIGYSHPPITACTNNDVLRKKNKCSCNPMFDFNPNYYVSCMEHFMEVSRMEYPEGWGHFVLPTLGGEPETPMIESQTESLKYLQKLFEQKKSGTIKIDGVIEDPGFQEELQKFEAELKEKAEKEKKEKKEEAERKKAEKEEAEKAKKAERENDERERAKAEAEAAEKKKDEAQ
ncbi:unnamed protein product [Kuraishia capsulata CBS 1993]|uniref:Glycosyltransferase family 15 protein n=1 Tax=Kuraishia capsulata CBS 1993 TaxID=1382522 RepID=W6MNR0_9ASCO|nr:uncharacterized protein KUCA_T00002671001 [Kuraishia capsulata CBS 1993]CDK26697.1 unnamed protein product [Kuraishia capsulata CBS 1993]